MQPVGEFARTLAEKSFAVFFGAGLSVPSGLPSARSLTRAVLEALPFRSGGARGVTTTILDAVSKRLPFEAFMETLHGITDVGPLLDVFSGGVANRNHRLLAQLMASGRVTTVCTTNFDDLLEQALADVGWLPGQQYQFLTTLADYSHADWGRAASRLIKVHGTINDRAGMAVTLRQVAAGQVLAPRKRVTDFVFRDGPHSATLVMGYSCSDIFDLSPQIESLSSPTEVFVVEHEEGGQRAEHLGVKPDKNPFSSFPGRRIYADTDQVISELAVATGVAVAEDDNIEHGGLDEASAQCTERWVNLIPAEIRSVVLHGVVGGLSAQLSMYEEALDAYTRALQLAVAGPGGRPLVPRLLADQAITHRHLGDLPAAIAANTAALGMARERRDPELEAGCLGNLCQDHLEMGNLEASTRYGQQALAIYRRRADEQGVARQLGTLGSVYCHRGLLADAEGAHRESLDVCQKHGFKAWEANQHGGLGKVYSLRGDHAKAIECFERAIDIAEAVGDQHILTNQLIDMSNALTQRAVASSGHEDE